jgi:hypothetical protein
MAILASRLDTIARKMANTLFRTGGEHRPLPHQQLADPVQH